MNYYERHIGDYTRDTAHLSMLEHGAYTLLMDRYYTAESAIPDDQKYRLARARTDAEKAAVDVVLSEFFELVTDVQPPFNGRWIQKRCEQTLSDYHDFIEKQRLNGRASAAKRALNGGSTTADKNSTTVEPPLDSGTNQTSTKSQPPTPHSPSKNTDTRANGSRKPKTGKIQLPDDFTLTDELAAYAKDQLPDADVPRLFTNFTTDAGAKGWKYASWPKAWQTYCRNARKDSGHFAAGVYPKTDGGLGKWM